MSSKLFNDSLGNFEYLLLGLTFLGVLYLVMKQANINVSVSKGDGMQVQSAFLAHQSQSTGATHGSSVGGPYGYEGMSMGSMEAPVWHATPYDPSQLDMVSFEQAAAASDYNEMGAQRTFGPNDAVSQHATKFNVNTEGLRGYSTAAQVRQGMKSVDAKLMNAMAGHTDGF